MSNSFLGSGLSVSAWRIPAARKLPSARERERVRTTRLKRSTPNSHCESPSVLFSLAPPPPAALSPCRAAGLLVVWGQFIGVSRCRVTAHLTPRLPFNFLDVGTAPLHWLVPAFALWSRQSWRGKSHQKKRKTPKTFVLPPPRLCGPRSKSSTTTVFSHASRTKSRPGLALNVDSSRCLSSLSLVPCPAVDNRHKTPSHQPSLTAAASHAHQHLGIQQGLNNSCRRYFDPPQKILQTLLCNHESFHIDTPGHAFCIVRLMLCPLPPQSLSHIKTIAHPSVDPNGSLWGSNL